MNNKHQNKLGRAIFLDRDGVINKLLGEGETPECYVTSWEQFEFLPGAKEAIARLLSETDYYVIVVSNQSGIGRGYAEYNTVNSIFWRMTNALITEGNGSRLYWYFCPHSPDAGCACRKPSPGMLYKAAIEHEIDLSKSWMVGDSNTDIEAGHRAGIGNLIKILDKKRHELFKKYTDAQANGRMVLGPYLPPESERQCRFFCLDLKTAVEYIIEQEAEKHES